MWDELGLGHGTLRVAAIPHPPSAASLLCVAVVALSAALAMLASPAIARVYWSAVAAACIPDRGAIQGDNYTSTDQGAVLPRPERLGRIVLICGVPFKQGVPAPKILSMTYRDTTGTNNAASVTAELVQVNRTTGRRSVIGSVSSDGTHVQTYNYVRSTYAKAPDFAHFYYHVRIVIARTATIHNVESIGVALEVPPIASFGPTLSYARVGTTTNAPTFPRQLTVTLNEPANAETIIEIQSLEPSALTANNVIIPVGNTSASVLVTALAQRADVALTATLQEQILTAHVRVLGDEESPATVRLTPSSHMIAPGATTTFRATLDLPPETDAAVTLTVTPPGGGFVPPSVIVLAGQTSADFSYTDISGNDAQITASFGSNDSVATVLIAQP